MSSETANKKKRTPSQAEGKTAADGDHRKRRRNRTTQSCLNCHSSKRMCDRRRPACSRCTQLGLTGLCVYEVDDPSQRSEPQDESSRLLKRVAELEGVIRELKNKPHPRWVQPRPGTDGATNDCNSLSFNERFNTSDPAVNAPIANTPSTGGLQVQIPRFSPSPLSTPSPTVTPSCESPPGIVRINNSELSSRTDLTSLFSPYSGAIPGYDDGYYGHHSEPLPYDSRTEKTHGSRCACLTDTESYNALLELSLRLRKATQILSHTHQHRAGSHCALNQRIAELDAFTSNRLTSMDSANESPMNGRSRSSPYFEKAQQHYETALAHNGSFFNGPPDMMLSDVGIQWNLTPVNSDVAPMQEDSSFMTWEPSSTHSSCSS